MKKTTALILAGTLCTLGITARAVADSVIKEIRAQLRPDFTVVIDGEKRNMHNVKGEEVHPILYEGTTYLPVRAIGEIMGKTVYWYEDDKRIELRDKAEDTTVTDADVIIGDVEIKEAPAEKKDQKEKKDKKDDKAHIEKNDKPTDKTDAAVNGASITLEEAKKIALGKAGLTAGDVTFTKAELDRDDGIMVYELEFRNGRIEYEADIRVSDGAVLSFEKDFDD